MSCRNYNNCPGCTLLAVVASIVIGIITAFLTFNGTIVLTPAFLWVVFGISVVTLGGTAFTAATSQRCGVSRCLCLALSTLIVGILGAILFSLILLAIEFAATSIIGAIFAGLLLSFFTLVITSVVCAIKCYTNCDNE